MRGIEQFSKQLKDNLDLSGELNCTDEGVYTLKVETHLVIQYADLKPGLNLMGVIGALPKDNAETLYMMLMRINLFGKATQGGVLGYDKESKQLIFTQAYPYEMTYREFKEAIEDFVNLVELWVNELEKIKHGETSLFST